MDRLRRWKSKSGKSALFFPVLVIAVLILLSAFKLSGTSVGIYSVINGTVQEDKNDLLFEPRGVRSDEWLVNTQLTVAQAKNGFKKINTNVVNGQNMAFLDVPTRDWSAIFKPQNLLFFILDLERAFAFKWWFMEALLLLATYCLALELFPKKVSRAVLMSLFFGLSPFIFWWWANGTILTLGYTILSAWLGIKLFKAESLKSQLGWAVAIAYVLTCFGLILYPPFQIPCLIALAAFMIGWLLDNKGSLNPKRAKTAGLLLAVSVFAAMAIGVLFYLDNKDAISMVTHTVYPGRRVELSGGANVRLGFSEFLLPALQDDARISTGYFTNQSEASNFILLAPFLLIPSLLFLITAYRKNRKLNWSLLLTNLLVAVFLLRMYVHTPALEPIYRVMLLDKVPSTRLLIGVGMAGLFQLLALTAFLDSLEDKGRATLRWVSLLGASLMVLILGLTALNIRQLYPEFFGQSYQASLLIVWLALGVFLILKGKPQIGLAVLVIFSILAVYRVNPVYSGLDPVAETPEIQAIAEQPETSKAWVVVDDRLLVNLPLLAGKRSLSGVQFYPQLDEWKKLDPTLSQQAVYNRYAHVLFSTDPNLKQPFRLKYADLFEVKFDACSNFAQKEIGYVLSPHELQQSCLQLKNVINEPARDYFIYQVTPAL